MFCYRKKPPPVVACEQAAARASFEVLCCISLLSEHKGSGIVLASPCCWMRALGNPGVPWQANLSLDFLAVVIQADMSCVWCTALWLCFLWQLCQCFQRMLELCVRVFAMSSGWLLVVLVMPRDKDVYKCRQEHGTSDRRVWQSLCRLPSLAGKQGSLWKMLSLHCGFTATMSTSTILGHLPTMP